jgi:nanoRNase/pAp phosphatase (c-di-AMP/oligoRNAs hydrolase)
MFSAVGYVEERDALPQAAEFLLRESDVKVVGLCGIRGYNIHISARSNDPLVHLGEVVTKTFSDLGSAGGHAGSAGVQISLDRVNIEDKSDKELIANEVANMCRKLFFTGFGIDISTKTV